MVRPRLHWLLLLAVPLLILPGLAADDPVDRELAKVIKAGLSTISKGKAKAHLWYLAGPKCEGRASGEKGCDVAAEYLAAKLEEFGVEPLGTDGYLQSFPIRTGPFPGQGGRGEPPRESTTSNVVGVVRGSDEKLASELLVFGAHYDHLGYRDLRKGKVYWGANDNASGTTAVLLLAEALAASEQKPRRSVMFLFFSGEERGLFGSKHYVSAPTWPLAETVAMFNLDMVARGDPPAMDVYGNRSSPELDASNAKFAKDSRYRFEYKGGSIFSRSDHYPFYERGIPVLFFTSGMYKDYHDLDDEPKRIVFGKLERIAEHGWRMAWDLGNREERPTYVKIAPSGAVGVLGFVPIPVSGSEAATLKLGKGKGAVEVQEVMRGTPAETAQLAPGDRILGLAGKFLSDTDPMGDLDALADGLERRKRYPLLVMREGRKKTVPIEVP